MSHSYYHNKRLDHYKWQEKDKLLLDKEHLYAPQPQWSHSKQQTGFRWAEPDKMVPGIQEYGRSEGDTVTWTRIWTTYMS
jgi:hypothetical protein